MEHRDANSVTRPSCETPGRYDPEKTSLSEVTRGQQPNARRRRGRDLITYGKSSRPIPSRAHRSLVSEICDNPPRRESKRADDSPHHISALLRAAERGSSDSPLSDGGLTDLDSSPTIGEVQNLTSSSLSAAEPVENSKGKNRVSCAISSNALTQRKPAPTHPQLTNTAASPDQHSHLKTRRTYRCPTTNGTTGLGREIQADDDSLTRSRSNPENRQSQAPLTTIRKRMKSSKLEHKIVKHERSRRIFPSKEKSSIGDGFEKTELRVEHRIVSHRTRKPWRREPIVYKQLSIAGGPLPDVMFERSTDELHVEQSGGPHHITARLSSSSRQADPTNQLTTADEPAQNPLRYETRANFDHDDCASRGLRTSGPTEKTAINSNHLSKRRVSFSDRDRFINAQLSSIKAPPRPQATSDDDDAEDSEEEDDEVESGTSEDEQLGALESVDAAKGIDDELLVDYADHTFIPQRSAPLEQPTIHSTTPSTGRQDAVDSSDDERLEGRIEAPRYFRRRSVERVRLIEADEPIDEFPDQNHTERKPAAVSSQYSGSTEGYMSRKI